MQKPRSQRLLSVIKAWLTGASWFQALIFGSWMLAALCIFQTRCSAEVRGNQEVQTYGAPAQTQHQTQNTTPSVKQFGGWKLQHKAEYCSRHIEPETSAEWTQKYFCGSKYSDDLTVQYSSRVIYLTVALVLVSLAQVVVYVLQARIMRQQAEISDRIIDLETPFLYVTRVSAISFERDEDGPTGPTFRAIADIYVSNFGRTAAILHCVMSNIDFTKEPPQTVPKVFNGYYTWPKRIIEANSTTETLVRVGGERISSEIMGTSKREGIFAALSCRLEYFDAFDAKIHGDFGFLSNNLGKPASRMYCEDTREHRNVQRRPPQPCGFVGRLRNQIRRKSKGFGASRQPDG